MTSGHVVSYGMIGNDAICGLRFTYTIHLIYTLHLDSFIKGTLVLYTELEKWHLNKFVENKYSSIIFYFTKSIMHDMTVKFKCQIDKINIYE